MIYTLGKEVKAMLALVVSWSMIICFMVNPLVLHHLESLSDPDDVPSLFAQVLALSCVKIKLYIMSDETLCGMDCLNSTLMSGKTRHMKLPNLTSFHFLVYLFTCHFSYILNIFA